MKKQLKKTKPAKVTTDEIECLSVNTPDGPVKIHCGGNLTDIAAVQPNPRNPNTHPEAQLDALARIIRYQGFRSPVVVSNRSGFIVSGHGRFEAAKRLGMNQVPVERQDFVTEADEYAHMIADNKLAELAELDYRGASELLKELEGTQFDLTLTGFSDAEAKSLMGSFYVEQSQQQADEDAEDDAPAGQSDDQTDNENGQSSDVPPCNKPIDEEQLAKTNTECPKCGFKWQR